MQIFLDFLYLFGILYILTFFGEAVEFFTNKSECRF